MKKKQPHCSSVLTLVALSTFGTVLACDGTAAEGSAEEHALEEQEEDAVDLELPLANDEDYDAPGHDLPYMHPLIDGAITGEPIPFAESKNDSSGARYAVESGASELEGEAFATTSGVVTFARRRLGAAERDAAEKEKTALFGARLEAPEHRVLSDALVRSLEAEHDPDLRETVLVQLRPSRLQPRTTTLDLAMARGEIRTRGDRVRVAEAAAERERELASAQFERLRGALGPLEAEVLQEHAFTDTVLVRLPLRSLWTLAEHELVTRVARSSSPIEPAVGGNDVATGHQLDQFIDNGYDGENISHTNDIYFGMVESGGADNEHPGFKEASGTSTRIKRMYSCGPSGCTQESNFAGYEEDDHATRVAGIIFGDLRDGQDPNVTSTASREYRSGYAGESRGWLYRTAPSGSIPDHGSTDGFISAANHIAGNTMLSRPQVLNFSAGDKTSDTSCTGLTSESSAAHALFDSGTLMIMAAGNENNNSSSDCRLRSPGASSSVFTVASLGSTNAGGVSTVRGATITQESSWGGTASEGGGRTLVDIAAYGCRKKMFSKGGGYVDIGCFTSYATPVVTATAVDFIDWYKDSLSDLIDDPGVLYANLLLMGDRLMANGGRSAHIYNRVYGAGRLRARKFDTEGMDSPWQYRTGWTCIDDGEVYTRQLNGGNTLSSSVDVVKAVIWWNDKNRHSSDPGGTDVDLRLKTTSGTLRRSSVSRNDNKERVFYAPGSEALQLEVTGHNIRNSTNLGCGTNSLKVYYAYYFEDSARDDNDGPGSDVEPE